jgi:tRNA nucleotidyltransferase (CCA-adding enzyme)
MVVNIPAELRALLQTTPGLERSYLVGGCVRDALLGQPVKDFDIEVYGVTYEQLTTALAPWGRTDLVGRSFGVIKLTTREGHTHDFSIPRRDSKVAPGHKGFAVECDPHITLPEAAARRDFTINALLFDPRKNEVLDFHGGRADLEHRILRHTSAAFVEDPLRVLRAMQFAARFELKAAPETIALCRSMKGTYPELAGERVRDEWFKWAAKSRLPSAGLHFLVDTGWIEHFPEVAALIGTPQDPEWHPEGDVFIHTCHCLDALVKLPEWQAADETSRIVYSLALLAHDFGKPQTTQRVERDGRERIVSPGHEEAGGPLAENFLTRINSPHVIIKRVVPLVVNHLAHLQASSDRAVRRLAKRLEPETIPGLCIVMTADSLGRPPSPPKVPATIPELRAHAETLQVEQRGPTPILLGRHLLELGMKPGRDMGEILAAAFDAQLEGRFGNLGGAYEWLAGQDPRFLTPEISEQLQARLTNH